MRWRIVTWFAIALGVLAATGLGADVLIAGPDVAAGIAGVIVGFCEVGALVLGVVSWAGEHRKAVPRPICETTPVVREKTDTSPARVIPGKYVVDARHARGVQIGDGTVQHNDFRRSETDGADS